jgi:uncharacterized protein YfbU (UPF0304 family)
VSSYKLTKFERLSLVNQYRILRKLDSENAEDYDFLAEVFEEGYTSEYYVAFQSFQDEMSPDETKDVMDTLEMYTSLQRAYKSFGQDDRAAFTESDLEFSGWDGNDEMGCRRMAFARFLRTQGRWATLQLRKPGDFNSHMPDFGQYERMLGAWREAKDRVELTADDVKRIIAARAHPDSPDGRKSLRVV